MDKSPTERKQDGPGVVARIKAQVNLVDFIQESGVELAPDGEVYRGSCPFHEGFASTSALFVFPDLQRWHCFACDAGGDLMNFTMQQRDLDFRAALEMLMDYTGISYQEVE